VYLLKFHLFSNNVFTFKQKQILLRGK